MNTKLYFRSIVIALFGIFVVGLLLFAAFLSPAANVQAASGIPPVSDIASPITSTNSVIYLPVVLRNFDPALPPEDWVSYTYDKPWDSFHGFVLHYPKSWLMTIQTGAQAEGNPQMILTLKKNQFVIEIAQGAGSVPGCLYPEDPEIDGFFSRYGEYTEIMKGNGTIWRRAIPESYSSGGMYYVVCELTPETEYGNPFTRIGLIELQGPTPDEAILNEFDEILRQIEILE